MICSILFLSFVFFLSKPYQSIPSSPGSAPPRIEEALQWIFSDKRPTLKKQKTDELEVDALRVRTASGAVIVALENQDLETVARLREKPGKLKWTEDVFVLLGDFSLELWGVGGFQMLLIVLCGF